MPKASLAMSPQSSVQRRLQRRRPPEHCPCDRITNSSEAERPRSFPPPHYTAVFYMAIRHVNPRIGGGHDHDHDHDHVH